MVEHIYGCMSVCMSVFWILILLSILVSNSKTAESFNGGILNSFKITLQGYLFFECLAQQIQVCEYVYS